MDIWLQSNLDAHSFIPREYWFSKEESVRDAIATAEVYVWEEDGKVYGFVGLLEDYIAGMFVERSHRRSGIGSQLLQYVKRYHSLLALDVYTENPSAMDYYLGHGFRITQESTDPDTGHKEYRMEWQKEQDD